MDDDDRVEEPEPWGWIGHGLTFVAIAAVAIVFHAFDIGKPRPPLTNYPVVKFMLPGYDGKLCNVLLIQYSREGFFYC